MKKHDIYHRILWKMIKTLHIFDYTVFLPSIARLPLVAGYALSALRGKINGFVKRDWRSMALGTRHIFRRSTEGYRMLFPDAPDAFLQTLVRERYETESREEFEGRLIAAERVAQLNCRIYPDKFIQACLQRKRGLLLLTPHFDSFMLGIAFLGMAGVKINVMTSAVTNDSRVDPSVSKHFFKKYRGMERIMNGGRMLDREDGIRPFYQMLERGECLVILADAPATDRGTKVTTEFLGAQRRLADGALRMALKTGSDLGAFVCRFERTGCYSLIGGPILNTADPLAQDKAYKFLSEEIMTSPGRWWAVDLLPEMSPID
ncbi:MAG: lysophospholipid acyltransferase family protein [Methylobacter sp.]